MSPRIAAATLVLVTLVGLSGCTGFPYSPVNSATSVPSDAIGDEGQTVEEACALIQGTIATATQEFEQASTEDPADVVDAMRSAAQELTGAASRITNDEVAALLPPLQAIFQQVGDVMAAIMAGDTTKVAELTELGRSLHETSQEYQQLCAP